MLCTHNLPSDAIFPPFLQDGARSTSSSPRTPPKELRTDVVKDMKAINPQDSAMGFQVAALLAGVGKGMEAILFNVYEMEE
jgi:hypothetical protein